jgi:hypothetical protein
MGMTASDWIAAAGVVVAAIGVLGTWTIAALALWGDWFKSLFPILRPALTIELIGPSEIVPHNNGLKARYYHLRVRNVRPRRLPAAHEAQVLITRVEEPGVAGQPTIVFSQTVPLRWASQEIYPLLRTIGPAADADFLWVQEDGKLQFMPLVMPGHFPNPPKGPANYWVTVQVRSVEAESQPLRLKVAWDGQWHDGATEIAKHLVVSPV